MGVCEISVSGGELVTVNAGDCHEQHDTVVLFPLTMILAGFFFFNTVCMKWFQQLKTNVAQ